MFLYKVESKKSPIEGEGLYTLEDIKKGSVVFYWGAEQTAGDKITKTDPFFLLPIPS